MQIRRLLELSHRKLKGSFHYLIIFYFWSEFKKQEKTNLSCSSSLFLTWRFTKWNSRIQIFSLSSDKPFVSHWHEVKKLLSFCSRRNEMSRVWIRVYLRIFETWNLSSNWLNLFVLVSKYDAWLSVHISILLSHSLVEFSKWSRIPKKVD